MSKFSVPDMSCAHCTASITNAIKAVDPNAKVSCDLAEHAVDVDSTLDESAVQSLIRDAGYSPEKSVGTR